MVKGAERGVEIRAVRLISKSGGRSGDWQRPADAADAVAAPGHRPGERAAGRIVNKRRGPA
jgi:hypothetical protein